MNNGVEQELLRVKRRRIGIRSIKASLDMEDLNLGMRQSALERLVQTGGLLTPASSIRNEVTESAALQSSKPQSQTSFTINQSVSNLRASSERPASARPNHTQTQTPVTADCGKQINQENPGVARLPLDGSDSSSNDINAVGGSIAASSRTPNVTSSSGETNPPVAGKRKRSPLRRAGFAQSLSPQTEPEVIEPMPKQSRIVTLEAKLCPSGRQLAEKSNPLEQSLTPSRPTAEQQGSSSVEGVSDHGFRHLHPERRALFFSHQSLPVTARAQPSQVTTVLTSPPPRRQFHSSSRLKSNEQALSEQQVVQHACRHNDSAALSRSVPIKPKTSSACPCRGFDPSCRLCKGTSAVTAQGAGQIIDLTTSTSASASASPSTSFFPSSPSPDPDTISTSQSRSTDSTFSAPSDLPARPRSHPRLRLRTHRPFPSHYHIPAFEEMHAPERQALELRFCRGAVAALAQRFIVPAKIVAALTNALRDLGEDKGLEDFARLARRVGESGRAEGIEGWVNGWIDVTVRKGEACLEACASAVNFQDRCVVVDEWVGA